MRFAASPGFNNAMAAVSGVGIDYNDLTEKGQQARSLEKQVAFDSQAKLQQAADQAEAMIESAKYGAQVTRAAGSAQGNASIV